LGPVGRLTPSKYSQRVGPACGNAVSQGESSLFVRMKKTRAGSSTAGIALMLAGTALCSINDALGLFGG
jgi:hypothetical protein